MIRTAWLALALIAPVSAQAPVAAPTLAWFHGAWSGSGTIFGRPATMTMAVAPGLLGKATLLTYTVDVAATGSQPHFQFEGRGVYRVADDGRVTGHWSDSQGNFHPIGGRIEGRSLTVNWGDPRTELGRSIYAVGDDGMLTMTDATISAGAPRIFATGRFTRAD